MNHRAWVAAPLAGAAIALVSPSAGVAAEASARHASSSLWLKKGGGHHGHRNPWRNCHSHRRVVLIDKDLRAILINDRHGPEALVVAGNPGAPASSPAAPWDSFTVATYLDVGEPTNTSGLYAFEIRDFFRVHPRFLVKAFDRHERSFPFPATHCVDREDDDDREDSAGPHGGTTGLSGSPSPRAVAGDSSAASWSDSLLSTKYILIAAGGLLMTLGGLAMAWLRRRRSAE